MDLLFTDVIMPGGMDGYELAQAVLERWRTVKIVLTSGFPEPRVGEGTRPSALRLLSKPYSKDELARVIRTVLDS